MSSSMTFLIALAGSLIMSVIVTLTISAATRPDETSYGTSMTPGVKGLLIVLAIIMAAIIGAALALVLVPHVVGSA
ncbi:hypothetical protein GCM10009720_08730 [Yaniella flava]|uniref:Uncharacterized protein n=1 Tax=Yaniella flava TaxID=287930 RepID=A0ABP5FNL4_9MICC|nr:hypothetical protein [Micrococcaceae bacterium]